MKAMYCYSTESYVLDEVLLSDGGEVKKQWARVIL